MWMSCVEFECVCKLCVQAVCASCVWMLCVDVVYGYLCGCYVCLMNRRKQLLRSEDLSFIRIMGLSAFQGDDKAAENVRPPHTLHTTKTQGRILPCQI